MPTYIIAAPRYDATSGGCVVLHQLCDLINRLGGDARLSIMRDWTPWTFSLGNGEDLRDAITWTSRMLQARIRAAKARHTKTGSTEALTHPALRTPLITLNEARRSDAIVIYPEIVAGNPLHARRVVRWCLHRPGYSSKEIWFGMHEYLVDYAEYLSGLRVAGLRVREQPLHLVHSPNVACYLHTPNATPASGRRGSAYLLKKGRGKPLAHDLTGSILIDPLSHDEIVRVFDTVETFYSYDPNSMFSTFAAARGAVSIVIPDDGVTEEDWCRTDAMRSGVGYGLDQVAYARATMPEARRRLEAAEQTALRDVRAFMNDVEAVLGP